MVLLTFVCVVLCCVGGNGDVIVRGVLLDCEGVRR